MNITTWSPDTCKCVIHLEWDGNVPAEQRTHKPVESLIDSEGKIQVHKKCSLHAHHTDIISHHAAVHEENIRKNLSIGHIKELHPEVTPTWLFDDQRNVQLTLGKHNLTKKNLDDLQISLGSKFNGKVKLI